MRVALFTSLLAFASALLPAGLARAQESDEGALRDLVREEIARQLNVDGALDAAIERGIKRFIARQQAAAQSPHVGNLLAVDARRDHIFGNLEAPVTLIEYSDFECPYCKHFHPTVVRLVENNADRLRWVYRHFPLSFHNPGAQKQAEASECVAELSGNDAFWQYTDLIYQRTRAGGNGFPLANLRPLAEEIGADGDAFDACLASGRMSARVEEDHKNGVAVGVTGTPAGVLTNRHGETRLIVGARPLEELQALVDELLR